MNNSQKQSRVRTVNAGRYTGRAASVKLNPDGLPVAFRRVACYGQPGSFAVADKVQIITPKGITAVTSSRANELRGACLPLN